MFYKFYKPGRRNQSVFPHGWLKNLVHLDTATYNWVDNNNGKVHQKSSARKVKLYEHSSGP